MNIFCARLAAVLLGLAPPAALAQQPVHLDSFLRTGRTVQARIGGRPGTFLLDTGGGVSNVTPQFAAAIGCKPWGRISGFTMTGQRLDMQRCDHQQVQLGTTTLPLETLGVFDGSAMMPPGTPHLDGTVALDAFAGHALLFSYVGSTITVLTPKTLRQATVHRTALPLHMVRDAEGLALSVNLPVATDAGTAWFELDAGNTSPFLLVGEHLATLLHLKTGTQDTQQLQAKLIDGSPVTGEAKVLDLTLDGNLGTSFLRHYDVVLDLAHAQAWLLPVAATAPAKQGQGTAM